MTTPSPSHYIFLSAFRAVPIICMCMWRIHPYLPVNLKGAPHTNVTMSSHLPGKDVFAFPGGTVFSQVQVLFNPPNFTHTHTPCSHTDTLLPHRHPAPTQTPCSHTDTLLPHRPPASTQTPCSRTANHVWASDTYWYMKQSSWLVDLCDWFTLLKTSRVLGANDLLSEMRQLVVDASQRETSARRLNSLVWCFQIAKTNDFKFLDKNLNVHPDPMCDESSCTRCRPGTMSGEPWKKHSVCSRTREPASVRAPENRRLYAHQRTGVCTRTREPASVRAPENRHLYTHQRTGVCTCTREPASVHAPENRRLYAHQRTGVCTPTEPSNTHHLHAPHEPLSFSGDVTTWQQSYNTSWHGDCHGYLLIALSISMVTSTDRAIVMGLLLEKMLQSILGNIRGSAGHCMWCVCINHVTTHRRTRRCLMMWEINERKDGKVRISI